MANGYGGNAGMGAQTQAGLGNEQNPGNNAGMGGLYVPILQEDTILDTSKVTKGYFTGDVGTLAVDQLVTSSLSTTQKNYYYNLQYSSGDQFSVTYGHIHGSGSDKNPDTTNIVGETEAIYKSFSSLLQDPNDALNGFIFDTGSTAPNNHGHLSQADADVYFVIAERERMKDRLNKKNWTLQLSGSGTVIAQPKIIHLTDDSKDVLAESTTVGPRYNIVSGTLGNVVTPASTKTYGWFYPNMGIMALRASELSSSIPGGTGWQISGSTLQSEDGTGLAPDLTPDTTADNAFKLFLAMRKGQQTFRSEEDQTTKSFFIRAKAGQFNFSNNPTFTSGSENRMTQKSFEGNPQTFITTVGLYNNSNELVAVGRLSSPIKKNHGTEATIKVNLTY